MTGALEIMKWVAFLVIYGGAGFIIEAVGYYLFFLYHRWDSHLIGLVCAPMLREELKRDKTEGSYWQKIADTFQISSMRQNTAFLS